MSEHTPGLAEIAQDRRGVERIYVGDWELLRALSTHGQRRLGPKEHAANRRRLAACWNACAGIPTAALEGASVKALVDGTQGLRGLLQLLASRDDLPAAVQSILSGNHWRVTEADAALNPFLKGDIDDS